MISGHDDVNLWATGSEDMSGLLHGHSSQTGSIDVDDLVTDQEPSIPEKEDDVRNVIFGQKCQFYHSPSLPILYGSVWPTSKPQSERKLEISSIDTVRSDNNKIHER